MYIIIIRGLSFLQSAELLWKYVQFIVYTEKSLYSVLIVNKNCKIQLVKWSGYNVDYIIVLINKIDFLFSLAQHFIIIVTDL
jgi:hypothetical protein